VTSLQHSRKPPSWIYFEGPTFKERREQRRSGIKRREELRGNGREGKERRGERKEEMEGMGACTHWNFRKSAPMKYQINKQIIALHKTTSRHIKRSTVIINQSQVIISVTCTPLSGLE